MFLKKWFTGIKNNLTSFIQNRIVFIKDKIILPVMNCVAHAKDKLILFVEDGVEKIGEKREGIVRSIKWTAPRYWYATKKDTFSGRPIKISEKNTFFGMFLQFTSYIATVLAVIFLCFPDQTLCFFSARGGLLFSLIVFLVLLAEFVFFKPRIILTLALEVEQIHKELVHDYPTIGQLQIVHSLPTWASFANTKQKVICHMKDNMFTDDHLRLCCFMKIVVRTLILLIWFAMVILFLYVCFSADTTYSPNIHVHLYRSFSLFLSIGSIHIWSEQYIGVIVLIAQVLLYFSVFIVVVGRFSDYMSMYSNRIEDFAHASVIKNLAF